MYYGEFENREYTRAGMECMESISRLATIFFTEKTENICERNFSVTGGLV